MADFEIRNEDERAVYLAAFGAAVAYGDEHYTAGMAHDVGIVALSRLRAMHPEGLGSRVILGVDLTYKEAQRIRREERERCIAELQSMRSTKMSAEWNNVVGACENALGDLE